MAPLVPAGLRLASSCCEVVFRPAKILSFLSGCVPALNISTLTAEALSAQAIFCQMGTIGVDATRLLQQFLQQKRPDVVFLDAPVSGTKAPAENAMITVFASGERSRATAAESVFAAISKGSLWLGEAGAGSRMKLVVNSWLIGLMQSLAESELLAESLGFSPEDLWQALEGGPLAAPYAKGKLQMISRDDFTPQMQLVWALKDARLATEAGDVQQLPALKNITELWQQAVDDGFGEQDLAVISKFLANRSKQ